MSQRPVLLSMLLLSTVAGCGAGDAPPKYEVSGTVSYQGLPIDKGTILFLPADGKGPPDGAPIMQGNFQCEATAGKKIVQIRASLESKGGKNENEMPAELNMPSPVVMEMVPEQYNSKSQLTEEVKSSGENVFEFKLE